LAASKLFSAFLTVPKIDFFWSLLAGAAAAACRADDAAGEHSGGSREDSLVGLVSGACSADGSSSEYLCEDINMSSGEDICAEFVIGDNDSPRTATVLVATFASAEVAAAADEGKGGTTAGANGARLAGYLPGLGLEKQVPTDSSSPLLCTHRSSFRASDGTEFL